MRGAITRCHQRSSEVIRGHQGSSEGRVDRSERRNEHHVTADRCEVLHVELRRQMIHLLTDAIGHMPAGAPGKIDSLQNARGQP